MKSKKFISVFLIFLFFINAGDIEDAEINISAQRVDSNDLVISWSMNEVENLQNIVLEVLFENPEDGQIENPLIIDNITMDELNGSRTINWSGESKLFIKLKISTFNFVQYTGDDCTHTFCLREVTEEYESEEFIIDEIPELPILVPTTIATPDINLDATEESSTVGNIEFTNQLITTIPIFIDGIDYFFDICFC